MKLRVYLIFTLLHVTEGCIISESTHEDISRSPGESVLLHCSCTDLQTQPDEIYWGFSHGEINVPLTGQYDDEGAKRYNGRVRMFNTSSPGNASLLISNLTKEDQGMYSCQIISKIHQSPDRIITLLIKAEALPPLTARPWSVEPSNKFVLILIPLLLLGAAAVIHWRCRNRTNAPSENKEEDTGHKQQQGEDVTYSTVVHGNTPRSPPRDTNTEETREYSSIKLDNV